MSSTFTTEPAVAAADNEVSPALSDQNPVASPSARPVLAASRILYLVDTLHVGGTERQMVQAAVRLRQAGHDVTVGCLSAEGPLLPVLRNAGIYVIEFRKGRSLLSVNGFYQLLRLAIFIRRGHFDVVHAHDLWSNLLGVPAAWLARAPIIISSRRYLADLDWYSPRRNRLVRVIYRLSTHVIVNSNAVRDLLVDREHVPSAKVRVIHNGIDLDRFTDREHNRSGLHAALSPDSKLIAVVANMYSEVKGHKSVIAAARIVCHDFPAATFLLIGDGRERRKLEQQVKYEGLERNILFLGHRDDVPKLLACCDLSVLPSEAEALPNSLMEAMAAGLPAVATRVGGNAEIVQNGISGLLVPPKDPEALALAILEVLRSPKMGARLARAGQERIRNEFGLDGLLRKLQQLYSSASGKKLLLATIHQTVEPATTLSASR